MGKAEAINEIQKAVASNKASAYAPINDQSGDWQMVTGNCVFWAQGPDVYARYAGLRAAGTLGYCLVGWGFCKLSGGCGCIDGGPQGCKHRRVALNPRGWPAWCVWPPLRTPSPLPSRHYSACSTCSTRGINLNVLLSPPAAQVIVYSKTYCPYCVKAKNALNQFIAGKYTVVEVSPQSWPRWRGRTCMGVCRGEGRGLKGRGACAAQWRLDSALCLAKGECSGARRL